MIKTKTIKYKISNSKTVVPTGSVSAKNSSPGTFKSTKDRTYDNLSVTTTNKVPVKRYITNSQPGTVGEIVYNNVNNKFYGWTPSGWTLLSGGGGGTPGSYTFINKIVATGTENMLSFTGLDTLNYSTLVFIGWGGDNENYSPNIATILANFNSDVSPSNYITQLNIANGNGNSQAAHFSIEGIYVCELGELGPFPPYVGSFQLILPNWNNTSYYKCVHSIGGISSGNPGDSFQSSCVSTWKDFSGINRVDFSFRAFPGLYTFSAGSTISLYGIV